MLAEEAIRLTRAHIEKQFPKRCGSCGRVFASLAQYLTETRHVGLPVSYDAELGKWTPLEPVGTLSLANCPCGTTMSISSLGMGLVTQWRLLRWGRKESRARGVSLRQLLAWLRDEIDRQVLAEHDSSRPEQGSGGAPA